MNRPWPWLFLLALALLGCGGTEAVAVSGTMYPPSVPIDACRLLPYEEAEAAAGESLTPLVSWTDRGPSGDRGKCAYGAAAYDPPRVVSLEVRRLASPATAAREQRSAVAALPRLAGQPAATVPDLGDEAAWAGGRLQQLHARRGNLRLIVTLEVGEAGGRQNTATALARTALERLAAGGG